MLKCWQSQRLPQELCNLKAVQGEGSAELTAMPTLTVSLGGGQPEPFPCLSSYSQSTP